MRRHATTALFVLIVAITGLVIASHSQEAPTAAAPPVGTIVAWHAFGESTEKPPAGWQLCDGSEITDPRFTKKHGKGKHTPNLNGEREPASKKNVGRRCFLRGSVDSPAAGYDGRDTAPHTHHMGGHEHGMKHTHTSDHTHTMPHRHRVSLTTTRQGGSERTGKGSVANGTKSHSHAVRGQTDAASPTSSGKPNERSTRGPDKTRTGDPTTSDTRSTKVPTVPRHFRVTFIIRVH